MGTNLALHSDFLAGSGDMGQRIRAFDWSRTPLGPIESWPNELKTSVGLILGSQHPMWIGWGREMTFLYNDAYVRVLGPTKHPSALGLPAAEVWAEIWEICGPLADRVFQQGQASFVDDVRLFMSRGDYFEETFYSFSYSPIRNDSGKVCGLFCPSTDVTPKILNARRLSTLSELGSRALISKTSDEACANAVRTLSHNPDDIPFALLYLVDEARESARLAGKTGGFTNEFVPVEMIDLDHDGGPWPVAQVYRTGQRLTMRLKGIPGIANGLADQPVTQAVVLPVASRGEQRPYGVLIAGVNPSRWLDAEYSTFFDLVAGQVATGIQSARTIEQEKKRADMLAEIDRAKTVFFSNVSHEFRTPLTLMLGPLENLLATPDAADREQLEIAHRQSLRLLKLVNSLLDFSRLEAGRLKATYAPQDLAALTQDLASNFRSAMQAGGLNFEVDCEPLTEPVYVDGEMWEKIVLNLLANAFKFTFDGGVKVGLRHEGGEAVLTVSDTGIGIPEEELPRIFERFHRVEGARGRTYEGTGIGLALIHEYVKLHGGTIDVESKEGRGTTFTVRIPFGKAHLDAERVMERAGSVASRGEMFTAEASTWVHAAPQGQTGKSGRPRILVADDNADMREYIARILETHYDLANACDGEEAWEMIRRDPPDLVLSDIMMPKLDGLGLLARLRLDPATSTLPVIFLSARAGEEMRIEGLEAGADDYLVKPFTANELRARVGTHLEMAVARRKAAERESELRGEAEEARDQAVSVLESITDGFVSHAADWTILYVNRQAERLFGKSREEIVGRNCWEVFPEAAGSKIQEQLMRAHDERVTVDFEEYYEPWQKWFHLKAYPTSAGGVSVIFEDIGEKRTAELATMRLAAIVDSSEDAIISKDLNGIITSWNRAAERLFGYTAAEAIGQSIMMLIPEDRRNEEVAILDSVRRGERVDHSDTLRRRKDGTLIHVALTISPVKDKQGTIIGASKIARDISSRKKAEAELKASEARFRQLAESMPQMVWTARPDGEVDYYNERWYEFTGASRDVFGDQSWVPKMHPEDVEEQLRMWRESLATGAPYRAEYRIWDRHEKRWRWFMGRAVAVRGENGEVVKWFGTSTDIDEQKRVETELRRANQDLEQFAYSASHDLQEPLRSIKIYGELLTRRHGSQLNGQALEFLDYLKAGATRMEVLVRDLLAYTQVTRFDTAAESTDAEEIFQATVDALGGSIRESGARITRGPLPVVKVHETHLRQLFQNLIGNAIKYRSPERAPEIQVSAEQCNGSWIFAVRDNGIGIPPEYKEQIFGLFKRLHTGDEYSGTGIGLAICQRIVERYGGRIWVESAPGEGSAFYFSLPE